MGCRLYHDRTFNTHAAFDHSQLSREAANEPLRAQQLRVILELLGPAYVKIAQAVSTRVDILSPAYLLEVERLQDRVPPFSTPQVLLPSAQPASAGAELFPTSRLAPP